MTIPIERYNAVKRAREFLYRLLDPKQTPRVPLKIRREARSLLKHFPVDFYMEEVAEKVPENWQTEYPSSQGDE